MRYHFTEHGFFEFIQIIGKKIISQKDEIKLRIRLI